MSFDIVGDIAIVEDKETAEEAVSHKNVNVVLLKKGEVEGEFRVRDYKLLSADKDARDFSWVPKASRPKKATETIHRESGCRFKVDPTKAYFSVRLGHERERITRLVKKDESVLVMFAGVGPYPIQIARNAEPKRVVGVELNPDAVEMFKENIELNKVEGVVEAIKGDVKKAVPKLIEETKEKFDRVIMPLPKESELFLDVALKAIKKGGTIHLYKILHENDLKGFLKRLKESVLPPGARIRTIKAGAYAPGSWRYCFDIRTASK